VSRGYGKNRAFEPADQTKRRYFRGRAPRSSRSAKIDPRRNRRRRRRGSADRTKKEARPPSTVSRRDRLPVTDEFELSAELARALAGGTHLARRWRRRRVMSRMSRRRQLSTRGGTENGRDARSDGFLKIVHTAATAAGFLAASATSCNGEGTRGGRRTATKGTKESGPETGRIYDFSKIPSHRPIAVHAYTVIRRGRDTDGRESKTKGEETKPLRARARLPALSLSLSLTHTHTHTFDSNVRTTLRVYWNTRATPASVRYARTLTRDTHARMYDTRDIAVCAFR